MQEDVRPVEQHRPQEGDCKQFRPYSKHNPLRGQPNNIRHIHKPV